METGTVKWYDTTKGFGFILTSDGKDLFVHRSGLKNSFAGLEEGQQVSFDITEGRKGLNAINVEVVE